jgi:hypothetical protein
MRTMLHASKKRIDIQVKASHIAESKPQNSSHCMIADALKAAMPTAKSIAVDLATIRFTDPKTGLRYIYLTPPRAQRALAQFDQGLKVEPFPIRLTRPAQVIQSGRKASQKQQGVRAPSNDRCVPTRLGGKVPPTGPLSNNVRLGKIRAYGLRATTAGVNPKQN